MRRALGPLVALLLTALGLAVAPPGQAADPLTGRLVSTDGAGGVAGRGPSATLGKVRADPAYLRGVLVDARTKRPVRGVRVAGGTQGQSPADTDVTDRKGRFVIRGITCEDDCYLRFRGRPRGYENGYRSCDGGVVATWEDACASPLGRVGRVRIQRL